MSYILGALKKADRERRRASEVKIADWDQDAWEDPTPVDHTARWLIGSVVAGLVVVSSVFGFVAYQVLEAVPQDSSISVEGNTLAMRDLEDVPVSERSTVIDQQETFMEEPVEESADQVELQRQGQEPPVTDGALPEFSGHLYFPGNPGMSRVFANSSSYKEGEIVNGYRIEQIGEQMLMLSKDGEQVRINLRN